MSTPPPPPPPSTPDGPRGDHGWPTQPTGCATTPAPPGAHTPPRHPGAPLTGGQPGGPGAWSRPAPRPPRRSRRWAVALGLVGVLTLGGGTTAFLVDRANDQRAAQELADRQAREAQELADAEAAYDAALDTYEESVGALSTLATDVDSALAGAATDLGDASLLLDAAPVGIVPEAERTALDTARAALSTTVDTWVPLPEAPAVPVERPTTTADLVEATDEIEGDAETVDSTVDTSTTALDTLDVQRESLGGAADALLATVPATSQSYVDTYTVSTNASRSEMQIAAAGVSPTWSPESATQLSTFADAANAVTASQAEQEALLANPVHPNRPVIEAFARSLAGGVPIDFSWAPEVNGYGLDGSSGGYATWNTAQYGYSTVTLSDNVAERWPEEGVQALVVHETGHAITSRCYDIYAAAPFSSDDEMFATSWAISMGYDDGNGSGEWAYGRPSDEQIAAAGACR